MRRDFLKGAAPGVAQEARCGHCRKLILVATQRADLLTAVVTHLSKFHDITGPLIMEGEDFTIGTAPHRCDLCLNVAEPPWWVYVTPSSEEFPVEDPEWLVCDACHALISRRVLLGLATVHQHLVDRVVREQSEIVAGLTPETIARFREGITRDFAGFLTHVTDVRREQ